MSYLGLALVTAFTVVAQLAFGQAAHAAATAARRTNPVEGGIGIYLTGQGTVFNVGQTYTMEVRENSNTTNVNAVQANIGYPTDIFQFVSIDDAGSAFSINAQKTAINGLIVIARGNTTPVKGDQLIARITLKAAAATGSFTLDIKDYSVIASSTTNKNISKENSGITGPVYAPTPTPPTSTPGPAGPPGPPGPAGPPGRTPPPAPIPTSYPIPAPSPGSAPNVSITPNPTPTAPEPQPTILPDESEIDVSEPSTIETTPSTDKTVQKVEYYINGKLVMTVNEPPYSYSVDTSNLRNGRYTLTTKTYYSDGKVDSVDAALIVKNPLSGGQLLLQLQHYAWLVIVIAIIIGVLVWLKFFKKKNGGGGDFSSDGYGGDFSGGDPYAAAAPPPPGSQIVAPMPGAPGEVGSVPGVDPNGVPQQYPPTTTGTNQYGQY